MMSVREALVQGSSLLTNAGNDTAALDASLLLAEVLKLTRSSLSAAGPDDLTNEDYDAFQKLLKRRLEGECVAYILGRKEFRGLDFAVNPSVLVPRPDTETLVEAALEELKGGSGSLRVLDLCTGCGAVAIALKNEMPELELWASDISAAALETAGINAARLLPAMFSPIHFRLGSIYEALAFDPPAGPGGCACQREPPPVFSLIVSNPPYIPTEAIEGLSLEVKKEPRIALDGGTEGLEIIRTIIKGAPEYLHSGGTLLLEADPGQMKKAASLLEQAGFKNIHIYRDLSGQERVIGGKRGKKRLKFPINTHNKDKNNIYSE